MSNEQELVLQKLPLRYTETIRSSPADISLSARMTEVALGASTPNRLLVAPSTMIRIRRLRIPRQAAGEIEEYFDNIKTATACASETLGDSSKK